MEKKIVKPTGIEAASYTELLKAVRLAMASGRKRAEEAVERERVRTAWEIGKLIDEHVLQHQERAGYDKKVMLRLSGDLGTSHRELCYMLEFYRAYPIVRPAAQLGWSDYEALLAVNDPEKRNVLAERAEKEGWKRDRLRKEVRNITKGGRGEPEEALTAALGRPGTYRVILAKAGPYAGELTIDLGFSNYYRPAKTGTSSSRERAGDTGHRPTGEFPFKEGEILQLVSPFRKGGKGDLLKISPNPSLQKRGTEDDLYTYESYIYEVLDGDTVNAVVDLGFGFVTTQTLRLRGIDTPEIATADGMEAKKALEKMLKIPGNGERVTGNEERGTRGEADASVLIKTVKSDKYDRYLADVFLPLRSVKTSSGGTQTTRDEYEWGYVNQRLVDQGHTVIVEE